MRALPIVVAQVPARGPTNALDQLAEEVDALVGEFPATRLIVYPEYHTCRVIGDREARRQGYLDIAEPLDGPRVRGLRDLATQAGTYLVPGTVVERGPKGELFNTSFVSSPDGSMSGAYRKAFPWRPFEPFTPGTEFVTFDIPDLGRVGLCICYDIWFPEVARQLAWLGAEVIICCSQTSTYDRDQELVLARATAISNQVFVVNVNAASPDGTGRSLVVDPEGLVRTFAPSEAPAFLTDVLDLDEVRRVREFGTCGLNRPWCQFEDTDQPLELPAYNGALDPKRWQIQADR